MPEATKKTMKEIAQATQATKAPVEMVNAPNHYRLLTFPKGFTFEEDFKYEVLDYIEHVLSRMDITPVQAGLLFNAIKYIGRVGAKDEILQELKKAQFYLNRTIKDMEEN